MKQNIQIIKMTKRHQNIVSYQKRLAQGLELAQTGHIDTAITLFQKILAENPMDYTAWINLTTLCLQGGQFGKAEAAAFKAISIDPFNFMGYYNLFALLNRNLHSDAVIKNPELILKALSCIYTQLGQKQKDKKLLNKALAYCEDNSYAYLARAELSQFQNKPLLAENDYQAAIYHHPEIPLLYLKKSQFLWRINRYSESKSTIQYYWKIKQQSQYSINLISSSQTSAATTVNYAKIGLTARQCDQEELSNMQEITIKEKIKQFQTMLSKLNGDFSTAKQSLTELQNQKQKQKEKQMKQIVMNRSIQQLTSKKINQIFINNLNDASNEDSSKNLTLEIQKLQKQIKDQGGNLSVDTSQNQTFLTQDIESAVRDIQSMKKLQLPSSNKSIKSTYTHKTINSEQLINFEKIKIQIVSAQTFEEHGSDQGKVILYYGKDKFSTQGNKDKLWREAFVFDIDHDHDHEEQEVKPIIVELEMKSRSIWSTKKIIGKGQINILSNGENKVILTDGEKSSIVYFKLKLI